MTVNTTDIVSGPYTGNGVADSFSYTFRISDKTQLIVYETTEVGVETELTVDTDYTVAGIGVDGGGILTRVAGALPTGYTWYIRSNYLENQLTAFASQGGFFPDVHEGQMDHLTFLIQQLRDSIDRSLRFPDSYSGGTVALLPLPDPFKLMRWNSAGTGLENTAAIDSPDSQTVNRERTIATAGQTVFTTVQTISGIPGHVRVVIDGIELGDGDEYTITSTNEITLAWPALLNQIVDIYIGTLTPITQNAADVSYTYPGGITRYVSDNLDETVSVGDFAAQLSPADSTAQFVAAYNAINGRGTILIPDGDYTVNVSAIPTTGMITWRGGNTTINGSIDPGALPGTWITNADSSGGLNGEYIRLYTSDHSPVPITHFGRALAWIMNRGSGGSGNSEQVTLINNAGILGNVSEFFVGLKATATTDSNGNVFGVNATGEINAAGSSSAECSAIEANIKVLPASIARKTGIQIVEVAASTGAGSSISSGLLITKQVGGAGFREAISIGSEAELTTPMIEGAGNLGAGVRFWSSITVDYGIDFNRTSFGETAIQLSAQRQGHSIGWKEDGVSSGASTRGLIQSDCTANEGGAIKFTDGGMVIQSHDGATLLSSIRLDAVTSSTDPLSIRVGSSFKQVTQGVADSGGVGFRVLRVAN